MKRERLKQAAVLLGVVLPAISAGAGQAEDDRKLQAIVVDACVEMNEKSYECREEFVDAFLELNSARKKLTPEQRAKQREKDMRDLIERGSGPIERRRAVCDEMVSHMGARAKEGAKSHTATLKSCYTKPNCKERVACMMLVIAEVHAGENEGRKH